MTKRILQNQHLRILPTPEGDQPQVLIPENDYGIEPGWRDVVKLLRQNKENPDVVQFIADMLEL
ncbi:MAG: hypothetical protein ACK4UO_06155 [Pseudolabrys sp.]